MISLIFVWMTSYQPAQASANKFQAKSIQVGDNLISLLRKHGFSQAQRERVVGSHHGLRNLFLTLDTKYLVSQTSDRLEMRFFDSQTSQGFKVIREGTQVQAFPYDPPYQIQVLPVSGKIHGSMMGSILGKVNSNWVATRFMDAYAFETKTGSKLRAGAPFSFSVEKLYQEGHFVKYGEILKTSLRIGNETIEKDFVRGPKDGGVFVRPEDLLQTRTLYAPVNYLRIASHFQPNRRHPITRKLQAHLGVDFEGPVGEPIFASKSGVVVRFGNNRAAGNYIVLLHAQGIETSYNHLDKIDRRIRVGLKVNIGEKIAEMGCTGYCTRPHLHFAVKKRGRMVDPLTAMRTYPYNMETLIERKTASN